MRLRALLATTAMVVGTLTALPAVAGSDPTTECPEGTFLAKYEDQGGLRFAEGSDVVTFEITREKDGGEVLSFTWSSTEPISQIAVKAGRDTTVTVVDGTSGSFEVPGQAAVSHVTFCLGEEPEPEVVIGGNVDRICWDEDGAGGYLVQFSYNNVSTSDGAPLDVDRAQAGFATSYPALEGQFPTTFAYTGGLGWDTEVVVTVTGWDGVADLTFTAFGDTATAKADPYGSMASNFCA